MIAYHNLDIYKNQFPWKATPFFEFNLHLSLSVKHLRRTSRTNSHSEKQEGTFSISYTSFRPAVLAQHLAQHGPLFRVHHQSIHPPLPPSADVSLGWSE